MPTTRSTALTEPPAAQLATLVDRAPDDDAWVHEIKYDGYRLLARLDGGAARLFTRSGKDWTDRFATVAAALARLSAKNAVVDGEVVVLKEDGTTDFQSLQNVIKRGGEVQYYVFDLLALDGTDLRSEPLEERKSRLSELLDSARPRAGAGVLRYSDHVTGNGAAFHRRACALGLEGIISKRRDAPYRSGRGPDWLKVKCGHNQEFVVVGFTEPAGSRSGLGALVVGAHDATASLRYTGRVGTGFSARVLESLRQRLEPLRVDSPPVVGAPRGQAGREIRWVAPELVVEVSFTGWTEDGVLRHPSFKGVREDKPAAEVRIELPVATEATSPSTGRGARRLGRRPAGSRPARQRVPSALPPAGAGSTGAAHRRTGGRVGGKGSRDAVEVAGVAISSPHKVLYAEQGITKLDLARYYEGVAEWMLPLIAERPLTLVRCPGGYRQCFYQKHLDASAHAAIDRVAVDPEPDAQPYGAVNSVAGLVALVQMGVLEMHTWGARRDRIEQPDRITLDLDPDEGLPWTRVVEAALEVRTFLGGLGLASFLKTTGGKGLHLVIPIRRREGWDEVKEFSRAIAAALAADAPGRYTLNVSKASRTGRVLIDYLRNGRGATAIEAFSTRARPGAPVAVPVRWSELGPRLSPGRFDLFRVPRRLASLRSDPWEGYDQVQQGITAKMKRAVGVG